MVNFDAGILLKTLRRPRPRLVVADIRQLLWLQGWKDGHDRWSQSQDFTDFDQCIWDPRIAREILWTRKKPTVGTHFPGQIAIEILRGNGIWIRILNVSSSCRAYAHLTDIITSASFQRISGMLKSTDSASCKPTSDCYAESFVQGESHPLSTNLPVLYRDIEIWKKDCLVCQWVWLHLHVRRIG